MDGAGHMVAGDVEFVFASRNERPFLNIHVIRFCNQCKNLLEEHISAVLSKNYCNACEISTNNFL